MVGLLGLGGSAVVELALDSAGRPVATKRVALTGSSDQIGVARRRLRREAEILRSLAHPGIVPVLDVVADGGDLVLVFPAMAENLEDRVARPGPLPPGNAADGCEARSDYVAGTALTQQAAVHANLVPLSAADTFMTHVSGDTLSLCWGSLHVTQTAPSQTAEQLTVWKGNTKVASALSANGAPATATVQKPSCFSGGSEDLRVTVQAVAATGGASANDFTLTRDAGW